MKRLTMAIIVWLLCSVAAAQITVPAETEVGSQLTATVNATVPPGAQFDGGWTITCQEGCTATYLDLKATNTIGIWAKPGTYRIEYRGYWVLLGPAITVKDVNGVDQTFTPFLGSGAVNEAATFVVTGTVEPDPDDGGDDDDVNPPQGPWKIVIFYDLNNRDNLPPQQRLLLSSLKVRKDLETLGHRVLEIVERKSLEGQSGPVPERIKAFVDSVEGDPYPRIAIMPLSGQQVVKDYPLPANYEDLLKLLDNPPESSQ